MDRIFFNPIVSSKTLNRSHPLMIQLEILNKCGIFNYMKWHTIHYNKELFFSNHLVGKTKENIDLFYTQTKKKNQ